MPGKEGPHVALVTGASRGIGAAIARRLARAGAAVILSARSRSSCLDVAEAIEGEGGIAFALELDVADPERVAFALEEARSLVKHVGPIDWLVANAGISPTAPLAPRVGTADGASEELAQRMMEVNFHGARRLVEGLLPEMRAARYGRIVNVASSAGLRGYAYASAYCASKFALVGYTLAGAVELASGDVTMNAVCPHYVDSPMTDETVARIVEKTRQDPAAVRAFLARENPGHRLVSCDEVAEAVLGLLESEENGALVELDGSPEPRVHHPNDRGGQAAKGERSASA
jgi:NAD(P)-dependent dehydrogenase (short-subunit alcohol dehydrogenase family)